MNWKDRTAYAFIKTKQGSAHQVWERFQSWDNVIGTWVVTGEYDVVAWFDAKDWDTIHDCIATIKQWDEVEDTNTHMVHQGYKTNRWWWEKPVGAWVLMKENQLDESVNRVPQWDWVTSGASIPGDWDYMAWVEGENWDDVWNHLMDVKTGDWRTAALVPIKSWWNQDFKDKWWQEGNPSSQVGMETTGNQQMY